MFSTFQPWSDFDSWTGATLKCSRHAAHSSSLHLSLPYWVISLGLSAAVTVPAVIEFGLFSLQTLTPDFIEGDGIWKVGDMGRQTLFLFIRWCTELEPLMWEIAVRPCSSVLLLLPFLSPPEDTMLWMSESLSAFLSWCLRIRILRSCRLWGGQFSHRLIKRWRWKWGFGDRLPLIWFQQPHQQWSCSSAPSQLSIQVTTPLFRLYSDLYYRSAAWTCLFSAVTDSRTLISSSSCSRKKTRVTDTKLPSRGQFWIFTDNIKHWLLTWHLNEIKTNINHMVANFIKPAMKANRRLSGPHLYLTIYI